MPCHQQHPRNLWELREITRRHFFEQCGVGVGKIALASALAGSLGGARSVFAGPRRRLPLRTSRSRPSRRTLPPRPSTSSICSRSARRRSSICTIRNRPSPSTTASRSRPNSSKDQRYAFIEKNAALMAGRYKFNQSGECGMELSEVLPELSKVADEICLIRSMHTDQFNHAPGQIFVQTGSAQLGRPSMGSWVSYGLGSEATDLPGFVVLTSGRGTSGGPSLWGSGFLPTMYQGVNFRGKGDPVLAVTNPKGIDEKLPARFARPHQGHERAPPRRRRRSRNRHAHQLLRDGLPHADQRAGADGSLEGGSEDARDVRREAG
jgi:hypothetical protein